MPPIDLRGIHSCDEQAVAIGAPPVAAASTHLFGRDKLRDAPAHRCIVVAYEEAVTLDIVETYESGVPELVAAFREPDRSTSMSYLYPAPVVSVECKPRLVLRDPMGERTLIAPP